MVMDFLTLFLSLRCTNKCGHCLFGCSPDRGEHMSWDVFQKALIIAKDNRIEKLNFFGGEPLLNPLFLSMLQTALEKGFNLIVATNCRPLENEKVFTGFMDVTREYRERMAIVTARDKFHLQFFDPQEVIGRLREEAFNVVVNDYSNDIVAITGHNCENKDLNKLDTRFSCCNARPNAYLGILPDGGWTICPASLEAFGNIFNSSLADITCLKMLLPIRYELGCTECLKDFKHFHDYLKPFPNGTEV